MGELEQKQKQENLRIQKTEWIYSQIQKQREAEDALFEQIRQEQDVLDRLNQSIENNMERTREARKYNQEFQEHMDAQVYAMYGITEDKLQGIREYRNAYYQGCAFSLFLLSVVLVVLCGILHGFQSQICLFMIAFSGIEGALLTQEKKRGKLLDLLCRILYLLMFPLMMVVFVCFELEYPEYHMLLPVLALFGLCVLVMGTAAYFCYNPYRKEKRKVGVAKDTLREIEKTARKEVRKNQKSRVKSEKQQKKLLEKEAAKQQKLLDKETERQQKLLEKEEKRQQRLQDKSEKQQALLEKKETFLTKFRKTEKRPAEDEWMAEEEITSEPEETERMEEVREPKETERMEEVREPEETEKMKEVPEQEETAGEPDRETETAAKEEPETVEGEVPEEAAAEPDIEGK